MSDEQLTLDQDYITTTFTYTHTVCGQTVYVTEGVVAPHRCRIDLDAQMGRCRHCGKGPDPDGDHSCPCPYRDEDCPDHKETP